MTQENKIMINDVDYEYDALDETQKYLVNQVRSLRARIAEARFGLDQMVTAEAVFSNRLIETVADDTNQDNA
jgi:hypothetical protein